jgi:hypothetical protein
MFHSSSFPIDLNSKKELNYYYSLSRYYTKLYIEMTSTEDYTIINTPLALFPLDINATLINNFKCIFSALAIRHLLNYDKKYYKLYYPELHHYQGSPTPLKDKYILKRDPDWKKCYQCCQNLDYEFLEEVFKFSRKLKKFQLLIEMMENLGLYEEAFGFINWIYDTLNNDSVLPFKEEGRYSRRKRKVINYNEYYSDEEEDNEEEDEESTQFTTPKLKAKIKSKPKPKPSPQITSPFTPNKLNQFLPSLYQKADHLANIINSYSSDTIWQYEASIESWMKKKKIKFSNSYTKEINNNKIRRLSLHKKISPFLHTTPTKGFNDIIIIDDDNDSINDTRKPYPSNKVSDHYDKINNDENSVNEAPKKKTKLIYYVQDDSSSILQVNDKITIHEPLPINDEIDDFLL